MGSGPAGLQAAIHASRRKVSVLVLGRIKKSSAYRAHIDNYCCIEGESGADLLSQGRAKAEHSGAVFMDEDVTDLEPGESGGYTVKTESGQAFEAASLVLAMGISRNRLGLENESRLVGRGVSYCVDCDGFFFKNEPVAVVGCESAAVSGALTLMFFASQVHLICETLQVNDYLREKVEESGLTLHEGRKINRIMGEEQVDGALLDDGTELEVSGIFIELGAKGAVSLAGSLGVALDTETMSYIAVNRKQETNLPGVYAAGDICGPPWQVAKSVGEGCVAGLEAAVYAKKQKQGA